MGHPVAASAQHHVAFRAFEARHTAELYQPLQQIDEGSLGRKLRTATQGEQPRHKISVASNLIPARRFILFTCIADLPQDLLDGMEGATVAEHAALIHSLKAQRRGRLLFLFVSGHSETNMLRDAENLWKVQPIVCMQMHTAIRLIIND
jgi:hypothetical protein